MITETNFEFDDSQNTVIGDLAKKMRFVGTLLLVVGVFSMLGGLISMFSEGMSALVSLLSGVVYFLVGTWTRKASDAFNEIVDTEGSDIQHLMVALGQMLNLYRLQYWAVVIILAVVVLAAVVGVVAGASA